MIKILILFSIVSWINFVVSEDINIRCNMKTDENIDDCIKGQLPNVSETENAKCTNVRFNLTNNYITKLPEAIIDKCNNPNSGICCSYIKVQDNTKLTLNGSLSVTILKNTPIDIPENKPLLDTTKIVHLELENCNIHKLYNETFKMLPNLKLLFLKNNALSELPENIFKSISNLQIVNLENNNLTTIPEGLFSNNIDLETVYLQNNNLNTIPERLFSKNTGLKTVHLENNNLNTVPGELFKNNEELKEVYLENNNLIYLPEELFTTNKNLMTVNLTNNKLTEIVVVNNKSLTVYILNQRLNISELCMNVNSTEAKIDFTDRVKPYCTMFKKVEPTLVTTTTSTINTAENSTDNSTKNSSEEEINKFKTYAWIYFFSVILFQLIILAILIVLYIRDKDDVSQKID